MNKFCAIPAVMALVAFSSCQKPQTDEERTAEINRRVEERLAVERQNQQQQELAQKEADLTEREKALAEKETADAEPSHPPARPTIPRISGLPDNRPTASYSTFYTKLDPYGVWRETSDYGYVWQPDVAQRSRDWRPYTNGRWVYTDVGWMWVSEEPFGWAAYHYGRWTRLRHIGWVWVPGDEWAPAWVSWRKGNDYVGWAPLPPEARFDRRAGIRNWSDNYYDVGPDQYCFVETRQFGAQHVSPTIVSSERNVTIVNQTTNVTNITYSNTRIVNQGPDYYELQKRTQQPIEHLRIERRTAVNAADENSGPVVRGEVIEISAPVIDKPQPAERPRRIKESVTGATADRGWQAVTDSQAAEKARAKIKSESTPPPDAPPRTFVKPVQAPAEPNALETASTSAPIASPAESAATSAPIPDERASIRSDARQGRRNAPTQTSDSGVSLSPTPLGTATPTPTVNEVVAPDSSPLPANSPRNFEKPVFPQKGEKKNLGRKSVAQQIEPRKTKPMPSTEGSPSPATAPVEPRDQKENEKKDKKAEKKEKKAEKKAEKKERRHPGESPSQTPTPAEL